MKGLFQSLIVYYITLIVSGDGILIKNGWTSDLWSFSITAYTSTFAVIIIELVIDTSNFTVLTHILYWLLTVILYFPCYVFVWDLFESPVQYMAKDIFGNPNIWLTLFLNMGIIGVYKYAIYSFERIFKPDLVSLLQKDRWDDKTRKVKIFSSLKKIEKKKNLNEISLKTKKPPEGMEMLGNHEGNEGMGSGESR